MLTFSSSSGFPFDFSSLPRFSEEQVLQREKQLASVQVLALKECLSKWHVGIWLYCKDAGLFMAAAYAYTLVPTHVVF